MKLVATSISSYAYAAMPKTRVVADAFSHWGYDYRQFKDPFWRGFMSKVTYCAEFIKALIGDATHILFVDCSDVLPLCGPDELMERYLAFNHPWVCAAEPHVWPSWSFKKEDYPTPDVYNRYLNSGGFIGEVGHIAALYEKWLPTMNKYNDDQHFLAGHCLLEYPNAIHLDTHCSLFQCMCGNDWNVTVTPGHVHNNMTNTDPVVIHWNGGTDITASDRRAVWEGVL